MLKLLQVHTSKDETRYHLCGVFFDQGRAIATDGHRLVNISTAHHELSAIAAANEGKIYSFKSHCAIDGKYPNHKQITPDVSIGHKSMALTFPLWFKGIKEKRRGPADVIYLTEQGFQLYNSDKVVVGFNLGYLAPYAGVEATVYYKDKLSPMTIKPTSGHDWTAVVMPIRI